MTDFSEMIKSSANTEELREKLDAYTAAVPTVLTRESDLSLSDLGDIVEENSHDMCQAFIVQLRQMREELVNPRILDLGGLVFGRSAQVISSLTAHQKITSEALFWASHLTFISLK